MAPFSVTYGMSKNTEISGTYPSLILNDDVDESGRGSAGFGFKTRLMGTNRSPFKLSISASILRSGLSERRLLISVLVAHWCESISLSISSYFPNLHTYITILSARQSNFFRKTASYLSSVTSDRTAQRFDRAVGSTREPCSTSIAQGYRHIS